MHFIILLKADPTTEAGVLPSEALLTAMGQYNEALVKAGTRRSASARRSPRSSSRSRGAPRRARRT